MSRFERTHKCKTLFLNALAAGSSVSLAAAAAGITPAVAKRMRQNDENFAKDWEDAIEEGTDVLEDAAFNRALKKSDALAMFMLKARRPDKFDRGSKLELSGGISVEGSKAKLLNKIARLQATGQLPASSGEEELQASGTEPEEEAVIKDPARLLPAPGQVPERGSKRRAAQSGNRRKAAA